MEEPKSKLTVRQSVGGKGRRPHGLVFDSFSIKYRGRGRGRDRERERENEGENER